MWSELRYMTAFYLVCVVISKIIALLKAISSHNNLVSGDTCLLEMNHSRSNGRVWLPCLPCRTDMKKKNIEECFAYRKIQL